MEGMKNIKREIKLLRNGMRCVGHEQRMGEDKRDGRTM